EVVSYISGRADSLAALFVLGALVLYGRWERPPCLSAAVACFALALLCKEAAVVLPLVLAGWEVSGVPASLFPPPRLRRLLPFFVVAAVYIALRATVWNFAAGDPILSKAGFAALEIGPGTRALLFAKSLILYIGLFFVPAGLHMERSLFYESVTPSIYLGLALAVGTAVLLTRPPERAQTWNRQPLFFVFWFFAWLLPQSAFIFPRVMAEHFLYLPLLAPCFFLASLAQGLPTRAGRWMVLGLAVLFYGLLGAENNRNWADEEAFFAHTVGHAPHSLRARDRLAALSIQKGHLEEARLLYAGILETEEDAPEHAAVRAAAYYNLGVIYGKEGRAAEALSAYRNAIALRPGMAEAYNNAGLILQRMDRGGEAQAYFLKAIEEDGGYCPAYNNLAQLYATQGDLAQARRLWGRALDICPGSGTARKNLELIGGETLSRN
ncbi:MAG: tetratricopeptide repeat protein, partial [Deltaproteobacteria bacterium]